MNPVIIDYTNHRGECRKRLIVPIDITFGSTIYHPEAQWLLRALDCEKNEERHFSMADIHSWKPADHGVSVDYANEPDRKGIVIVHDDGTDAHFQPARAFYA